MKKQCTGYRFRHSIAFLVLFIAVCSIGVLSGGQKAKAATEGAWEYSNTTGGVKITNYSADMPIVTSPSTLGGKTVVALSGQAFYGKQNMHTVTIPPTVRTIEDHWGGCFHDCKSLMTVNGLENVTYIGSHAFSGCVSLENLTFSNGLTYIGEEAFNNTGLTGNLSFPASLEKIHYRAFYGCAGITAVTVPEKVTVLGASSFMNCTGLVTADIKGACDIGTEAFKGCTSLQSVTASSRVKEIQAAAFAEDIALETVVLEDGVQTIGNGSWQGGAFYGCTSLKTIHIPKSVRTIFGSAFEGCTALNTVSLEFGLLEIKSRAFYNCSALEEINIPNSVAKIEAEVFSNCISLTDITMPNSVQISDYSWSRVFSGCNNVTVYGYPGSKVEQYVTSGEDGLSNLTFVALTAVPATEISFKTEQIEIKKGELKQLEYTMSPAETTDAVTWTSSDSNKVSVNQLGEITAKSAGTVTITATTTSGYSDYITVIVPRDPTRISFGTYSKTISRGQTYSQAAKVYDDAGLRTDILPTYESSNPVIASVDQNGLVRGLREGTVTIIARTGGISGSYTVKVVNSSGNPGNGGNPGIGGGNKKITISKLQITRKGKKLTIKTIPGASVKVSAKKSILGKSSKTATANSKGVAKINFKKKIKKVTVTVTVSKAGYTTKTVKQKFKK